MSKIVTLTASELEKVVMKPKSYRRSKYPWYNVPKNEGFFVPASECSVNKYGQFYRISVPKKLTAQGQEWDQGEGTHPDYGRGVRLKRIR